MSKTIADAIELHKQAVELLRQEKAILKENGIPWSNVTFNRGVWHPQECDSTLFLYSGGNVCKVAKKLGVTVKYECVSDEAKEKGKPDYRYIDYDGIHIYEVLMA